MQALKLSAPFLVLVLAGCVTPVADRGDTVPRQLAEDLASGQIYLAMPEGFPEFELPDGIDVQGALDRGFNMSLVLITRMSPEQATDTVVTALQQAGWTGLDMTPYQPRGGFVSGAFPALGPGMMTQQLCHDDHGNLSVNPRSRQGVYTRISLDWNMNAGDPRMTCAQQNEQRQGRFQGFNPMAGLNEHMPVLELPEEDRGSRFRPAFGGGVSGSGDAFTARTPLTINWSLTRVRNWFADQLEEQGWRRDANWAGRESAGSTWSKTVGDDDALSGLLDIVHVEEDNYQLRFRISYKNR